MLCTFNKNIITEEMIFVCNSNVNCDRHIKKRYLREKDDHAFFSSLHLSAHPFFLHKNPQFTSHQAESDLV